MSNTTTGPQWLARIGGFAGVLVAIAITLHDALVTGHWTLDHVFMPVVIGVTVSAGHLAWTAASEWKAGSTLGFALLFALGTGATLYNSVGRQSASADKEILAATAINDRIARKEADLEKARKDLDQAKADVAEETGKGGCKSICKDRKAIAEEIKDDIRALEAELAELGPRVPVSPKASRTAQVFAWFGVNEARTLEFLQLVDPFVLALWAELTGIVCLGYGFPHRRSPKAAAAETEAPATETAPVMETKAEPMETVAETVRSLRIVSDGGARFTRRAAEADIREIVARGETVPSQEVLKARWGDVPKGTVSKWLSAFEEAGLIQRQMVGRRKTVSAR